MPLEVCINFWPDVTMEWVRGRWQKPPGEDMGPPVTFKDGPDHSTRLKGTIPVKGRIAGWLHPIDALHRCQYVGHGVHDKVVNPPPRKANQLIESGHGRHAVQVAIEYSYKLGQKMNLNFGVN